MDHLRVPVDVLHLRDLAKSKVTYKLMGTKKQYMMTKVRKPNPKSCGSLDSISAHFDLTPESAMDCLRPVYHRSLSFAFSKPDMPMAEANDRANWKQRMTITAELAILSNCENLIGASRMFFASFVSKPA